MSSRHCGSSYRIATSESVHDVPTSSGKSASTVKLQWQYPGDVQNARIRDGSTLPSASCLAQVASPTAPTSASSSRRARSTSSSLVPVSPCLPTSRSNRKHLAESLRVHAGLPQEVNRQDRGLRRVGRPEGQPLAVDVGQRLDPAIGPGDEHGGEVGIDVAHGQGPAGRRSSAGAPSPRRGWCSRRCRSAGRAGPGPGGRSWRRGRSRSAGPAARK